MKDISLSHMLTKNNFIRTTGLAAIQKLRKKQPVLANVKKILYRIIQQLFYSNKSTEGM